MAAPPGEVLLLPGFGGTSEQPLLVSLSTALEARGYLCHRVAPPRRRPDAALSAETAWLEAVVDELRGAEAPLLIGRSFGARIAARVAVSREVRALVLLGFPVRPPGRRRPMDEAALVAVRCPTLVVQGTRDELGPLPVLRRLARANPLVSVRALEGARHAFGRRTKEAIEVVTGWLGGAQLVSPGTRR